MTLRVYVAASSRERDLAREMMGRLRDADIEITHDWVEVMDRRGDETVADEVAEECATRDLDGVSDADVFWLLRGPTISEGASVELGWALRCRELDFDYGWPSPLKIVISGANVGKSIFHRLADRQFERHEGAFVHIIGIASKPRRGPRRPAPHGGSR